MINLSSRLKLISEFVPLNSKVMDIGCDHGLLDIYLYQNKIVKKIIASDINFSALNNAIENIKANKLEKEIETRLSDGLENIHAEDEIDTLVIAGMGSNTIVNMLKKDIKKLDKIKTIIIQSNTKLEFLRSEIVKLNYYIADEAIVEDNKKIYIVIKFIKGRRKYTKKELYFGPILLSTKSLVFQKYTKDNLKKLQCILSSVPKNKILLRYKIKKEIHLYQDIV
jgi:ribosomal protein L11 methyltransferase (prmA)